MDFFITTNYLWLKSDNTNILCMKAHMCFACILNVTHCFCRPRNVSNRSLRRGVNTVSLLFVVFEVIKKEKMPQNCYAMCTFYNLFLYFVSIIWHLLDHEVHDPEILCCAVIFIQFTLCLWHVLYRSSVCQRHGL